MPNVPIPEDSEPLPTRSVPLGEGTPVPDPDPDIPSPVSRPRITVVSQGVHQLPGEKSKSGRLRFYRWLESTEEAYERLSVKVGEEWQPLDLGWLKESYHSLLIITNATKRTGIKTPTEAERLDLESKVLEIGIGIAVRFEEKVEEFAYAPVGEGCSLSPRGADRYRIRCLSGEGRYSIFLAPA